jgi:hypothetical protein
MNHTPEAVFESLRSSQGYDAVDIFHWMKLFLEKGKETAAPQVRHCYDLLKTTQYAISVLADSSSFDSCMFVHNRLHRATPDTYLNIIRLCGQYTQLKDLMLDAFHRVRNMKLRGKDIDSNLTLEPIHQDAAAVAATGASSATSSVHSASSAPANSVATPLVSTAASAAGVTPSTTLSLAVCAFVLLVCRLLKVSYICLVGTTANSTARLPTSVHNVGKLRRYSRAFANFEELETKREGTVPTIIDIMLASIMLNHFQSVVCSAFLSIAPPLPVDE